MSKRYIWGFPGVGKSSLNITDFRVVDADSNRFEFRDTVDEELHGTHNGRHFVRDKNYPENYFDYIQSVDADVVLINCHLSLLDDFDKESLLVVYPSTSLLLEYRERWESRGDNASFISYMENEFEGIVDFIDSSDFKKFKVAEPNIYLSDLFERNDFKMRLMTRKELIAQIQRAMDLNVIDTVFVDNSNDLVCDLSFAAEGVVERRITNADVWAEAVLNGEYSLDIDQLLNVCELREKQIEQEKVLLERRGGLSREELADKIMQGIVNGALGIYHGQIAPYSYGYAVTFTPGEQAGAYDNFKNRWECYCDFFDVPNNIVKKIEKGSQNGVVRGDSAKEFDVNELLACVDEMEHNKITSFVPESKAGVKQREGYIRGHISSVANVHEGLALDGVVKHHFHGDYSSMTTSSYNSLCEKLVFMKGFCLDCLKELDGSNKDVMKIVEYLKKHGTDISTPEKLNNWILNNPDKCALEENRRAFVSILAENASANAGIGVDNGGGYYTLKDFEVFGLPIEHYFEVCVLEDEDTSKEHYAVYHAVGIKDGETLFHNWEYTDDIDNKSLEEVISNLYSIDYTEDVESVLVEEVLKSGDKFPSLEQIKADYADLMAEIGNIKTFDGLMQRSKEMFEYVEVNGETLETFIEYGGKETDIENIRYDDYKSLEYIHIYTSGDMPTFSVYSIGCEDDFLVDITADDLTEEKYYDCVKEFCNRYSEKLGVGEFAVVDAQHKDVGALIEDATDRSNQVNVGNDKANVEKEI